MKSLRMWFGLFVLVAAVYIGYQLIPPYFNDFQFRDALESEARVNTYSYPRKSDEEIRARIMKVATDLELPVRPEQIAVDHSRGELVITADYTVHVDLPLHPVDLNFHTSSKR